MISVFFMADSPLPYVKPIGAPPASNGGPIAIGQQHNRRQNTLQNLSKNCIENDHCNRRKLYSDTTAAEYSSVPSPSDRLSGLELTALVMIAAYGSLSDRAVII
jgi:hypothetical protein